MSQSHFTTRQMATAGIIAAVYAALTLLLPIPQYGGIQFRVAEAMTVLPFFFPEAIPGLAVGCFLANLLGSPFVLDWGVRHPGHPAGGAVDVPPEKPLSGAAAAGDLQCRHRGGGDRLVFRSGRRGLLACIRAELCDCGPGRGRRVLCAGSAAAALGVPGTRPCAAGR